MKKSLIIFLLGILGMGWSTWAEARTYVVRPSHAYYSRGYYPRAYYPRSYYSPYYSRPYYPYTYYYPGPYFYPRPYYGPAGYYNPYYFPGYYGGGVGVYYNGPGFGISVGSGY